MHPHGGLLQVDEGTFQMHRDMHCAQQIKVLRLALAQPLQRAAGGVLCAHALGACKQLLVFGSKLHQPSCIDGPFSGRRLNLLPLLLIFDLLASLAPHTFTLSATCRDGPPSSQPKERHNCQRAAKTRALLRWSLQTLSWFFQLLCLPRYLEQLSPSNSAGSCRG